MASQLPPPSSVPPDHMQNETNQNLKSNEYQQQDLGPKLLNGGQIPPNDQQKGIKSPPSNGNSAGIAPPNEMMMPGGYHDPNLGPPPMSSQPGQHHMHHPGDKDEMSGQAPHHHQQHPSAMYGHQTMHGHPGMHGPPPQQHMPGHHMAMHPVQQRYHPHQGPPPPPHAGPPHGMQHPMHPHDMNQQQMDPYGHYRGMMPTRPPQRYGLPPQGPVPPNSQNVPTQQPPVQQTTPTLNSLLQSQPSPQQNAPPPSQQQQQQPGPQHRYPTPGPYDPAGPYGNPPPPNATSPMPPQNQQQQSQQQQGWAPPRPYSPQQYRGPPANASRGQSPYPPSGQSPGPGYPPGSAPNQQQTNQPPGPPMPPQQYQYPQRYPTPPANPQQSMGPQNHRPPYSQWPSPAASPGPGPHGPPPAQSPHAPPPQSPGPQQQPPQQLSNAPSPSPQPPQSPHQFTSCPSQSQPTTPSSNENASNNETGVNQKKKGGTTAKKKTKKQQKAEAAAAAAAAAAQNSSENASNAATNNQQQQSQQSLPPNNVSSQPGAGVQQNSQPMRPISSPNSSSSGSRSMSPAVGQNLPMPPRPSSSHSQQGIPPQSQQGQQQQPPQQINQGSNQGLPMEGQMGMSSPGQGPPGQPHMQAYPPHMQQMGAYKQMGPYPPQSQYSPQYAPRGQFPGYPGSQQGPPYSPGQNRPLHNHVGSQQGPPSGPPPHQGYPPHQGQHAGYPGPQNLWPPPPQNNPAAGMQNHIPGGKNIGPPHSQSPQPQQQQQQQPPPNAQQQQQQQQQTGVNAQQQPQQLSGGSPRQLNYLKQHLQHKGGYAQGSTPPPQSYGNGPAMTMGPPMPPSPMGPPVPHGAVPQSHMENASGMNQMPPNVHHEGLPPQDNVNNGMPPSIPHQVTSIVTTGPDGTQLDEASQQSTLSNTSIASGDETQSTPKNRKNEIFNHPMTPSHANASPGPNHPHSGEENFEMGSPSWPRTPASPVFNNSHAPQTPSQETFSRSTSKVKKSDSLAKLYEMDENPERKVFLDKLLGYMEEIRKPVTACPTISKQPLDLYRLYTYVKERSGFMEVCKVTKNKTWKDVAGLLGIGASSSAAYTLRKHYIKSILPYECQFDRGGIDPLPLIQSVEAGTKKKTPKPASVPSPGSSNSQDSFPPPGSGGASMDGYGNYPGQQYPQPPVAPGQQEYQRPPSQSNAQTPHPSGNPPNSEIVSVSNPFEDPVAPRPYQHTGAQYPVSRPQGPFGPQGQYQPGYGPEQPYTGQYPPSQGQYPPNSRQMYPPYGPEGDPNFRNSAPPAVGEAYRGYPGFPPPGSQQGPRPPFQQQPPQPSAASSTPPHSQPPIMPPAAIPPSSIAASTSPQAPSASTNSNPPSSAQGIPSASVPQNYPPSGPPLPQNQDFYNRQEQQTKPGMSSELARELVGEASSRHQNQASHVHNPQARRHPDFTKEAGQQPYSPYGGPQRPQMYGGWPNAPNSGGQFRGQYPPQSAPQWPQGPGPRGPGQGQPQGPPNQWEQNRYPMNQQYGPNQPWPGQPGSQMMRPPQRGGKPYPMPPPQGPQPINKIPNQFGPHVPPHMQHPHHPHQAPHMPGHPSQQPQFQGPTGMTQKREITFPSDTVEATQPVLYRRKRMTKHEIGPIDAWRLFMSLKSGLLSESTWALDVMNVLLFDDAAIAYFGLVHLPGLLNLLLEHFQKNLTDMFDASNNNICINAATTHAAAIKLNGEDEKCENDGKEDECSKANGGDNNTKLSSNLIRNSESGDTRYNKPSNDDDNSSIDLGAVTDMPNPAERLTVLKTTFNYTMQSRKGVPVKIQDATNDIFIMDNQRSWDNLSSTESYIKEVFGDDPFNVGQEPNSIEYIINAFKAEISNIPFARYIKSSENGSKDTSRKVPQSDSNHKPYGAKRMRLTSEEEREIEETTKKLFNKTILKKEPANTNDTDCRQVDMEVEKLTNGPISIEKDEETKEEMKELEIEKPTGFDVRSTIRDPAKTLKRLRVDDYEDECFTKDEASLYLVQDNQDSLARRCLCLSTILRNLTFVPGNELEFAKSSTFLSILGKLLLYNHEHPIRIKKQRNYDREEDADFSDSCSSLQGETEWYTELLMQIRENMLVAIANISGYLDLSLYDEPVSRPILDGLLHWAVCPSAQGQDPFSITANSNLSPQRLALESLCKLCVTDSNVDLVISTPPFSRLERLCAVLTKHLCKNEDQVLREFSVNLLHYLASAESSMARIIAKQSPCVSYLVAFIEQAEQTALGVANQHGINFLRENPDSMGTSLDMLRRAAGTLFHLAKHPDNRPLFMQQEQRLLGLVMSHILDQQVANIISRVLFQTSRGTGPLTSTQEEEPVTEVNQPTPQGPQKEVNPTNQSSVPEQKLPPPMSAPNTNLPVQLPVPNQQMKSPAVPQPPTFNSTTKLLNNTSNTTNNSSSNNEEVMKQSKLKIPTSSPAPSSAIPQTVTASS